MSDGFRHERREAGEKMYQEVYGDLVPNLPSSEDRPYFFTDMIDHLFGEIWSRPGLSVKERRLLVIGVLAREGLADVLEIQFKAALKNGELNETAIREIVPFMSHYVGFPHAGALVRSSEQAIAWYNKREAIND